jgi:uncharacterized membrane protein
MRFVCAVFVGLTGVLFPSICSAEWVLTVLGPNLRPASINDRGDVAGRADIRAGHTDFVPFVWTTKDGLTRLYDIPNGSATDINNKGQVVGIERGAEEEMEVGFLWNAQGSLTYMSNAHHLQISGMNERGQVAGIIYECGQTSCSARPMVWTIEDGTVVLPDLGEGGQALAINRHGDIAGVVYVDGVQHGATWSYKRHARESQTSAKRVEATR